MSETAAPSMKTVELLLPTGSVRAGWFPGASREAVVAALKQAARLEADAEPHFETEDGIAVAVDDSLPGGIRLRLAAGQSPAAGASEIIPVPGPRSYPFVGNLPEFRRADGMMASIAHMHAEFGDLVAFKAPGAVIYFCSDAEMVSEVRNNPDIFAKIISGRNGLATLSREGAGNGLFTSSDNDPIWHQAHRILSPAFGASALKNYYGRILAVSDDLLAYLDALEPGQSFLATDLMTRMTFEAISYAAFNKRYGSIGAAELPPFVAAMNVVLSDAMAAQSRVLPEIFYREAHRERDAANQVLMEEVDAIVRDRRAAMERGEPVPTDLLQIMLTTPDRITGLKLPDSNIRNQLITFLIAGHETTSGLLSYTLYHLWKNPQVMEKLIAEADAVLGRDYSYRPTYEDCAKLDYAQRVLKEALRLTPTAPMIMRQVMRDTTIGGRYQLKAGHKIGLSLQVLHRHPHYWGENADSFDPDRFLPEAEAARHPDAYHPFGMGMRACIGFQFALLEAKMVLARFAQRFVAKPLDPKYVLREKQTLTIKPDHLDMVVERRPETKGRFPAKTAPSAVAAPVAVEAGPGGGPGRPMLVLYGSNMGSCRDIAVALTQQAGQRGYAPVLRALDEQAGQPCPTDGPVVIVTSTYNGTPPDNAAAFAKAIADAPADTYHGVRYAVLGCGNRQWHQTFQKFPKEIDTRLQALGGEPIVEIGVADADGDFEGAVEAWTQAFWSAVGTGSSAAPAAEVDDLAPTVRVDNANLAGPAAHTFADRTRLEQDSFLAPVTVNRELQAAGSSASTHHLEITLPAGIGYKAGDHLGVFPHNAADVVAAVAERCRLDLSATVVLSPAGAAASEDQGLPFGVPVAVGDLLANYVDLTGPVTRRDLRAWAKTADCPPDKARLQAWLADVPGLVGGRKPRLTDLLAEVPSVRLDLATLLSVRPTLKPRYYSISSSPLLSPEHCSITVGVQHFKGADGVDRKGLCSSYLADTAEGATLRVVVKDTGSTFRLPEDPLAPIILVGPGTGLAPLRGFLQERHALRARGIAVGRSLLFFGCRSEADYLYREELEGYEKEGTLSLLAVGFSRLPDQPKTYVQDLIRAQAPLVAETLAAGASVFVCGNARGMAPDVRKAFTDIVGGDAAIARLDADGRYHQDVWANA
ncbi:bifunctional cytochrome P450/NADPH--P450 reductase [Segnochrobactrum spirostomi]|uniref:Bifunctional cytochrome P450/NADPH--P450 reductase n=1 Tax=Segnochrobactrum spirostomi TaxID=2608987 RepID=A0A6A7Y0H7_9HYPH|nr:cytochrome P450 [Segnochrobactrum spirostomi]MQT12373.1 cytochrome P450 [Segnochrobactrum spirostomi]